MSVVQLDARAGTRSMKTVKFDEPNTNSVIRWRARTNMRKKFVNAVRTTHNFQAREDACVTRIEEVDDVVREESEEQWKQEEVESSEKQRPRASKVYDKRVNKKEFNTKLRIFRFADMASREEDGGRTVAKKKSRKRDKSQSSTCTACAWTPRRKDKTFAFLVARERPTRAVLSTVGSRKPTGEWTCRRLMAWLREIGWEFVDITVKSDNEAALTSLIELWSTLRAMKSGSRMINEKGAVGSSKSNGIAVRAIQSEQGTVRTIRSATEEKWEVKIDVTHSVWPWKVQCVSFAKGMSWKRRRAGRPLGKLTCMWDDGVYLVIKATTGEVIVVNRNGV